MSLYWKIRVYRSHQFQYQARQCGGRIKYVRSSISWCKSSPCLKWRHINQYFSFYVTRQRSYLHTKLTDYSPDKYPVPLVWRKANQEQPDWDFHEANSAQIDPLSDEIQVQACDGNILIEIDQLRLRTVIMAQSSRLTGPWGRKGRLTEKGVL